MKANEIREIRKMTPEQLNEKLAGLLSLPVYRSGGRVALPFWDPLFTIKIFLFNLYRTQIDYEKMESGLKIFGFYWWSKEPVTYFLTRGLSSGSTKVLVYNQVWSLF